MVLPEAVHTKVLLLLCHPWAARKAVAAVAIHWHRGRNCGWDSGIRNTGHYPDSAAAGSSLVRRNIQYEAPRSDEAGQTANVAYGADGRRGWQ